MGSKKGFPGGGLLYLGNAKVVAMSVLKMIFSSNVKMKR